MYYLFGLGYALYNGLVRKIDTQDDPLQPFAWVLLWPIGVIGLVVTKIHSIFNRHKEL